MAGRQRKKGRGGSSSSSTIAKTPSALPSRYQFTPATLNQTPQPVLPNNSASTQVRDYPPPQELFQSTSQPDRRTSASQHPRRSPLSQLLRSPLSQTRSSPPPQDRRTPSSRPSLTSPPERRTSASHQRWPSPPPQERGTPSSEAQNSHSYEAHSDDEEASFEEAASATVNLAEDQERILTALLAQPGREEYTTVLSPIEKPNTTWFGRDKSSLTRKITKIFTNKFDGPYYSWTCVPRDRQERYFVKFAKTHTWDPLLTGVVQQKFEKIYLNRLKDMVSTARTTREQPRWICDTLWEKMTEYWDTDAAKDKSLTTSAARMSDRDGFGPHKNFSGQKSYLQIQQEMEEELARPVSLGEVFIKTHTKADGTFVDLKAKKVAEAYKKSLQAKLSALGVENSESSDGTSCPPELSVEEDNELFLNSTYMNERGIPYGVGSLSQSHVNGKRKYPESSESYNTLQEQLEAAQRQIVLQAAETAKREAKQAKVAASQQAKMTLLERYLTETDPRFLDYLAAHSTAPMAADPTFPATQTTDLVSPSNPTAQPTSNP